MSNNWLKRARRYLFPTQEEKFVDGINWAAPQVRNITDSIELENWANMLPLCALDPFDRGVLKMVNAQHAKIEGKDAHTLTVGYAVPAWAQGPLPIAEEHLVLEEAYKWPAPTFNKPVDPIPNPPGYAEWVRSLEFPRPVMTDARGVPVKPRIRVKAGRRVI